MYHQSLYLLKYSCLLLLCIVLFACEQATEQRPALLINNDRTPLPVQRQVTATKASSLDKLFIAYEEHLAEYDNAIYFENWSYDPQSNNITCSSEEKKAQLEFYNHRLGLGFKQHIAKENKKTLQYTAVSPFANFEPTGLYNREKPLKVNGKPFSGVLIGTHIKTGKRLIEARFYEGVRVGEFKVWSNLGRMRQQSFGRNDIIILKESAVRKPIIYLYPTQTQTIKVALDFKGELTHTYPKYPQGGWEVQAQPNGLLTDLNTGKDYGYLFWEGQSSYQYQAQTGFVVAGEATADFLDEKLAILGLNRAEATDFVSYWLPELENNAYNLIHFSQEAYQEQAVLDIHPRPETLLRVFMVYQPLSDPVVIPTQELLPVQRQGFTVVEWGGKQQSNLWHPQ